MSLADVSYILPSCRPSIMAACTGIWSALNRAHSCKLLNTVTRVSHVHKRHVETNLIDCRRHSVRVFPFSAEHSQWNSSRRPSLPRTSHKIRTRMQQAPVMWPTQSRVRVYWCEDHRTTKVDVEQRPRNLWKSGTVDERWGEGYEEGDSFPLSSYDGPEVLYPRKICENRCKSVKYEVFCG